jgi:PAS domain-containing protein
VVEELADAVLVVDARGRLLDANARARALLGGEGLTIGRPLRDAPEAAALLPVLDTVDTIERVHHVTHAGGARGRGGGERLRARAGWA